MKLKAHPSPEERAERARQKADAKRKAALRAEEKRKRTEARQRALEAKYQQLREAEMKQRREDFWAKRYAEAQSIQQGASDLPTAVLLDHWRKYVGYLGFPSASAPTSEWLIEVSGVVAAIEDEWKRRAKLFKSNPEYFSWPSANASKGSGELSSDGWASRGMLAFLGYHVGNQADLSELARQTLLRRVFEMNLPPLESSKYIEEWGKPRSAKRLQKMAESVASFVRQAKRRTSADLRTAIAEWETDLNFLHHEFYVAQFGFGWPNS